MSRFSRTTLSIALFATMALATAATARAECWVVTPNGSGARNGSNWSNAFAGLPSTLQRGDTYYLADGDYPPYNANTPASGTTLITIKKAIPSDHCIDTGWNEATMGSGSANFVGDSSQVTVLSIGSPNWVFDGQRRSSLTSGHGLSLSKSSLHSLNWYLSITSASVRNVTVRYMKIQGFGPSENTPACNAARSCKVEDLVRFFPNPLVSGCTNLTLSYMYIFNASVNNIHAGLCENVTVEHSQIEENGSGSYFHGQGIGITGASTGTSNGWIVRHNVFKNIRGTGVIAIVTVTQQGTIASNWQVYGNVFYHTPSYTGTISQGVWGCLNSAICNNLKFHHNTIVGIKGSSAGAGVIWRPEQGATGFGVITNNLWYANQVASFLNLPPNTIEDFNTFIQQNPSLGAGSSNVNLSNGPDPFVNWQNGDFRLRSEKIGNSRAAGQSLSAPFHQDATGVVRGADGHLDRGAFEFVAPNRPGPPQNVGANNQ